MAVGITAFHASQPNRRFWGATFPEGFSNPLWQPLSLWQTHPVFGFGGGRLKLSSMKSINASQLSKHR